MIKVLKKSITVLAMVSLLVATSGISFAATNQKVVNETSQKVVTTKYQHLNTAIVKPSTIQISRGFQF